MDTLEVVNLPMCAPYFYPDSSSEYHCGLLYTESRVGSLIAIGKGDVPEEHWYKKVRTLPTVLGWQSRAPSFHRTKLVRDNKLMD